MLISINMAKIKNSNKKIKKVRKDVAKEIEIPGDIEIEINGREVIARKDSHELKRVIGDGIMVSKEGSKIILKIAGARRKEKSRIGAFEGHIKNMIEGLREAHKYELEVCNVHFPMSVSFDKAKKEVIIKNMLGEKTPRIQKVSDRVEIEIKMPKITIKSYDLEAAGQTAADLEKMSKIRNRDRNKFQDGIFITKKPGRESF